MSESTRAIATVFERFTTDRPTLDELERLQSLHRESSPSSADDAIRLLILRIHQVESVGKIEQAAMQIEELSGLLQSFPSVEFEAWRDYFEARLRVFEGKAEEAVLLFRRVLTHSDELLSRLLPSVYYYLAALYFHYGATDEAITNYQECARLASSKGNAEMHAYAFAQLSSIYNVNGQHKQALELNQEALRLSKSEKDPEGPLGLRTIACSILLELGRLEEAEAMIRSVQDEIARTKNKVHDAGIETLLGKLYFLRGDYVAALDRLRLAVSGFRAKGWDHIMTNSLLLLAEVLIKSGSYREAAAALEEVKSICEKQPNSYHITAYHEMIVALRTAEGRFEDALAEYKQFYDAKQKILSQESERRMALLRIEHHVQQKEKEAEVYRLKSEQLEKELMNKTGHLVKQAEMLSRFRDDTRRIISETMDAASGLRKVREKIRDLSGATMDWEEYDKTFAAVHPDFKQHLVSRFPSLTPMETKVCTLLRIELTSKEIANLLNISERSVENHRYRARKKVGLGESESMNQFLASL